MEILEIYHYEVNEQLKNVEITFRLTSDSDDESRVGTFEFSLLNEYGVNIGNNIEDFVFESEEYSDEFDEEESEDWIILDEEELISFLNEYYTVNPKDLPEKTFF
jgi:hypothetical protein